MIVNYHKEGMSWRDIASKLNGRTAEQVRERFQNKLDPSLLKRPFTEEERQLLCAAREKLGNQWADIAALLPGRSVTQCKNCWHNGRTSEKRALLRSQRQSL